MAMLGHYHETF